MPKKIFPLIPKDKDVWGHISRTTPTPPPPFNTHRAPVPSAQTQNLLPHVKDWTENPEIPYFKPRTKSPPHIFQPFHMQYVNKESCTQTVQHSLHDNMLLLGAGGVFHFSSAVSTLSCYAEQVHTDTLEKNHSLTLLVSELYAYFCSLNKIFQKA